MERKQPRIRLAKLKKPRQQTRTPEQRGTRDKGKTYSTEKHSLEVYHAA